MLPIPGIEFLDDGLIPETARPFYIALRYVLLLEIILALCRLFLGDIAGALSDVIGILFGVFFMRQDPVMRRIYLALENTAISACCNGGTTLVCRLNLDSECIVVNEVVLINLSARLNVHQLQYSCSRFFCI